MNRIATMTVIRSEGECLELVNGVLQKDIEKLKEQHMKELDRMRFELETVREQRDKLRSHVIKSIDEMMEEDVRVIDKIVDGIEYAWCVMWGLILTYLIEEKFDEED